MGPESAAAPSPRPAYSAASAGTGLESTDAAMQLLRELALDVSWSWNHSADVLWHGLEPELWARTHSPWVVLLTLSPQRLAQLLTDAAFRTQLEQLAAARRELGGAPAWYQQTHPQASLQRVAYFSLEFMLSEALPIYAGGLGNVAGDQLKAASDLGIPITGIGLLYQQGYFRQTIASDGSQQALFPYNDPGQLPLRPVRRANGQRLRLELQLPAYTVWVRAWEVVVGRLRLYLLDSNDIANQPAHRSITSELYGGGAELRLQQELILGIGGWRLLEALEMTPDVCHLNEGHAALVILERARAFMQASGQPFNVALTATRAGNVFTTHTAVAAGFDRFEPLLVERYLKRYAEEQLRVPIEDLLALGRCDPQDPSEPFNMAYLAAHGSAAINGVSRLHAEVSRHIFQPLFARWPSAEVPVGHITNGVHTPSWDSARADALWTGACGKQRWRGDLSCIAAPIQGLPAQSLWECRNAARQDLIAYARERLARELDAAGASAAEITAAHHIFRPDVLTLGFARRFTSYKRPNLLLRDPERLVRLLTSAQRPVQLLLAGKAHPEDVPGQAMVRDWVQFVRRPDVRSHAMFLADYDMLLTEQLVQGVDVWLNTPRRPWEACGTSGMKVLVNGGLNLSELDGWWSEAYTSTVGWALGDGQEHADEACWDDEEAEQLYRLLEEQVIPEFYARDSAGIPQAWLARVRQSMAQLTPVYSANRSVREYLAQAYLPAAAAYSQRAAHLGAEALNIASWQAALQYNWPALRIEPPVVQRREADLHFRVPVHLGALSAPSVRVQLYAENPGAAPFCQDLQFSGEQDGQAVALYTGCVAASRPAGDYTVRIIPYYPGVQVPLEAPHIFWQR